MPVTLAKNDARPLNLAGQGTPRRRREVDWEKALAPMIAELDDTLNGGRRDKRDLAKLRAQLEMELGLRDEAGAKAEARRVSSEKEIKSFESGLRTKELEKATELGRESAAFGAAMENPDLREAVADQAFDKYQGRFAKGGLSLDGNLAPAMSGYPGIDAFYGSLMDRVRQAQKPPAVGPDGSPTIDPSKIGEGLLPAKALRAAGAAKRKAGLERESFTSYQNAGLKVVADEVESANSAYLRANTALFSKEGAAKLIQESIDRGQKAQQALEKIHTSEIATIGHVDASVVPTAISNANSPRFSKYWAPTPTPTPKAPHTLNYQGYTVPESPAPTSTTPDPEKLRTQQILAKAEYIQDLTNNAKFPPGSSDVVAYFLKSAALPKAELEANWSPEYDRVKAWDTNQSGTIDEKELANYMRGMSPETGYQMAVAYNRVIVQLNNAIEGATAGGKISDGVGGSKDAYNAATPLLSPEGAEFAKSVIKDLTTIARPLQAFSTAAKLRVLRDIDEAKLTNMALQRSKTPEEALRLAAATSYVSSIGKIRHQIEQYEAQGYEVPPALKLEWSSTLNKIAQTSPEMMDLIDQSKEGYAAQEAELSKALRQFGQRVADPDLPGIPSSKYNPEGYLAKVGEGADVSADESLAGDASVYGLDTTTQSSEEPKPLDAAALLKQHGLTALTEKDLGFPTQELGTQAESVNMRYNGPTESNPIVARTPFNDQVINDYVAFAARKKSQSYEAQQSKSREQVDADAISASTGLSPDGTSATNKYHEEAAKPPKPSPSKSPASASGGGLSAPYQKQE